MDDRPIVWDAANRRHLGSDHPERRISLAEIGEALQDGGRIEIELADRQAKQVIGRTTAGRWLRPNESFGGSANEDKGNPEAVQRPIR